MYINKKEDKMKIEISSNLKNLSKLFPSELFIVGGFVRNSLLGIDLVDVDLCSSLTLDKVAKLLEGSPFSFKIKSKTLGTALITIENECYEYSVFRKEYYGENGQHSPEKVEFITDIQEDAKRRDFTINAIYYDINKDEIIDFYHGVEDIKNKILRTVETPEFVLSKDGARLLRLFRFQCELGFKIEKETLLTALKYAGNVKAISNERKLNEMGKIINSSSRYSISKPNAFMRAFKLFNRYQVWPSFGLDTPKVKFNMIKKVEQKAYGLLIDIIDTVNPISVSYYLERLLADIGLSKKAMALSINILSGYYAALNKESNKPYFFKYFDNFPIICQLINKKSKLLSMKYEFFYKYIISHKLVISIKDLQITGDDIKKHYPEVNPKRYKAILESLLSDVFDCKLINNKKELIAAVNQKLKYL